MRKKYPLKNGYFGEQGRNSRVIISENHVEESKSFYEQVSKGGEEKALPNGKGVQTTMVDEGVVTYREKTSTPDSPAVDFGKMKGQVKKQKVHFVRRKRNGK